jgi:hypothetical protein
MLNHDEARQGGTGDNVGIGDWKWKSKSIVEARMDGSSDLDSKSRSGS